MPKEVQKNSYNLEEQAQRYVQEGQASIYFSDVLDVIKNLKIDSVRDVSNSVSDQPSADFVNALRRTKQWFEGQAAKYSIENKKFGSLDEILKDDPFSEAAVRFKWHGLYDPKDIDSPYYTQYITFSTFWQEKKRSEFRKLVDHYWDQIKAQQKKESPKPGRFYSLKTAVITAALVSLVGIIGTYTFIEHIFPKKAQQQSQIIINEIIRPAIREEVIYYQSCGVNINEGNINQIAEALEKRYSFLKNMRNFPLPQIIQEEAAKLKKEQEQQQEKEPPQSQEEDF